MPTLLQNSAENVPNNTTPTLSNSAGGSDTGIGNIFPTGGALVASTLFAAHGTKSFAFTAVSGSADYFGWSLTAATTFASHFYVYFTAVPPTGAIHQYRSSAGQVATVGFNSVGHLVLQNGNLPTVDTVWTATQVIPTNEWVRIELGVKVGTTTSNGVLSIGYYVLDSTTSIETFSQTNMNTGTANINEVRWGKLTGTDTTQFFIDDIAVKDGSTTFLGAIGAIAPGAPTGVTITAGTTSVSGTATAPASNGGSTITGYVYTASTGQSVSVAGLTFTITGLTAGTPVTVHAQAVNAVGTSGNSAESNSATPLSGIQTVYPIADVTVTNWTPSTGSTVWGVLDEVGTPDNTDYATSSNNPSSLLLDEKMGTMPGTPANANGWSATITALLITPTTGGSAVLRIRQGSAGTIISTSTVTLSTTATTYTLAISSAQAANITDLTDLHWQILGTAS